MNTITLSFLGKLPSEVLKYATVTEEGNILIKIPSSTEASLPEVSESPLSKETQLPIRPTFSVVKTESFAKAEAALTHPFTVNDYRDFLTIWKKFGALSPEVCQTTVSKRLFCANGGGRNKAHINAILTEFAEANLNKRR